MLKGKVAVVTGSTSGMALSIGPEPAAEGCAIVLNDLGDTGAVSPSKVAAMETDTAGIDCNAICRGWVLTSLVQKQIEARAKENGETIEQAKVELVREKQPMLTYTTPANLGALAVFLCGDAAATMTGESLPMDGGWLAQ